MFNIAEVLDNLFKILYDEFHDEMVFSRRLSYE